MKINIKDIIIEEGILDGFKSKTGLGLAGIAGGAAGIGLHKDFQNTGSTSVGNYLGKKYDSASNAFDKFKNDFKQSNTNNQSNHNITNNSSEHNDLVPHPATSLNSIENTL